MKRRRQTLQVTTFPFLAVLLCTMGSLILILMVMDRRARVVALARLQNVVTQRTAEQEAAERARKEEWERARQALRDSLESQLRELRGEKGSAEEKAKHIGRDIAAVEAARKDLQGRIQAQRSELSQKVRELEQQGLEASSRNKLTESARTELQELAAVLDAMERTLVDLKALRQKKEQAFSLVPYRGKHGDNRRPIYVECNSRGVVFQPGRFALDGYEVSPLAIRKEIDRRLAQFRTDAGPQESKEQPAYVLMLLRPSGIRNYYQFVSALAGLKIDFGYELLEEGWEIAFADDDRQAGPTPLTTAQGGSGFGGRGSGSGLPVPGAAGGGTGTKPGGSWVGAGEGGTASNGVGIPGTRDSSVGSGNGVPGGNGAKPGGSWAGAGTDTGLGGPSSGAVGGNGNGSPNAILGSPLARGGSATGGANSNGIPAGGGWSPLTGNGSQANPGGASGNGSPGGSTAGTSNSQTASASAGSASAFPGNGRTTIASSHGMQNGGSGSGTPSGGFGSGGQAGNSRVDGHQSQGRPGGVAGQSGEPAGGNQASPNNTGAGANGRIASGASGEKSPSPLLNGSGHPAKASTPGGSGSGSPGQSASRSNPGRTGEGKPAGEQSSEEGSPPDNQDPNQRRQFHNPLAPPAPTGGVSGPRNPLAQPGGPGEPEKPARPMRVASNRDWTILVECTAEAVILPGTGQRFELAQLQLRAGNDNPLLQAVRTVIARRQATVRANESEWKPQLRFLVHADGLRSYYAAFPALESLRLPMTKQNRQEKEEEE
jgi:hypothetical protein